MVYRHRASDALDHIGGVPAHLPYVWPRCQMCQEWMGFVGQLYASDWFPLGDHLALQFYVCDECRQTFSGANDFLPIHMEVLPKTAVKNVKAKGVRCKRQSKRYIIYDPVEDSMDQWTFNRRNLGGDELPDKHLFDDKVGGLFPYDGYEGPRITRHNRMVAQFRWSGMGGPIYLYHSTKTGFYPFHYR